MKIYSNNQNLINYINNYTNENGINVEWTSANKAEVCFVFMEPELDSILDTALNNPLLTIRLPQLAVTKIQLKELNYINIINRHLCYHMSTNENITGHTLRTSFAEETILIRKYDNLYFLEPGAIININNIKIIHQDRIEFYSGEDLYLPKPKITKIKEIWA